MICNNVQKTHIESNLFCFGFILELPIVPLLGPWSLQFKMIKYRYNELFAPDPV